MHVWLQMLVDAVGLPVFQHVLTPRSKGLWLCTERLRACTSAFYDVTIAYSSTLQSADDGSIVHGAAPTMSGIPCHYLRKYSDLFFPYPYSLVQR